MRKRPITIVKQVLAEAAEAPHFFDLSDAQRLSWMIERAYTLGKESVKLQQAKRRAPNRPRGTCVQLTIQLRPQPRAVYSGRRK